MKHLWRGLGTALVALRASNALPDVRDVHFYGGLFLMYVGLRALNPGVALLCVGLVLMGVGLLYRGKP